MEQIKTLNELVWLNEDDGGTETISPHDLKMNGINLIKEFRKKPYDEDFWDLLTKLELEARSETGDIQKVIMFLLDITEADLKR